jgi:hypothetical protein
MRDSKDHNRALDPTLLELGGSIRRMAISLTAKVLWQLVGFRKSDGTSETRAAEPFTGIGFYSRPASSGKPEAIVLMVGDSKAPVVVATRDEKTRRAIAGGLDSDESMMFNSQAVVYVKRDGTIEVRSSGGTAKALATKDDVDAINKYLRQQFDPAAGHVHKAVVPAAPSALVPASNLASDPPGPVGALVPVADGTSKLKGE